MLSQILKRCNSKNNDDIANAPSGIMANDLKYQSIYSVERIRNNILHTLFKNFAKIRALCLHGCKKATTFIRTWLKEHEMNENFFAPEF